MLTRASTLAGDACKQVGAPDTLPGASPLPTPAELSTTLDEELSRLDGLVSATASEVGSDLPSTGASSSERTGASVNGENASKADDAAAAATPAPKAASPSGASASSRNVPDFMLEFTEPAAEPSAKPTPTPPTPAARTAAPATTPPQALEPASATAPAASIPGRAGTPVAATGSGGTSRAAVAKPGVVGTGMLGVVSTTKDEPATTAVENAGPKGEVPEEGTGAGSSKSGVSKLRRAALAALVRLLEILDRPFVRLSDGLKELIGWIALATLGTALVVYLIRVI